MLIYSTASARGTRTTQKQYGLSSNVRSKRTNPSPLSYPFDWQPAGQGSSRYVVHKPAVHNISEATCSGTIVSSQGRGEQTLRTGALHLTPLRVRCRRYFHHLYLLIEIYFHRSATVHASHMSASLVRRMQDSCFFRPRPSIP